MEATVLFLGKEWKYHLFLNERRVLRTSLSKRLIAAETLYGSIFWSVRRI